MTTTPRPDTYPDHAMSDPTYVGPVSSAVRTTGYIPGDKGIVRFQNGQMNDTAKWLRHLDEGRLAPSDLFSSDALISPTPLTFPLGAGLSPAPTGGASYILNGERVDFPTALLATTWPQGALTHAPNTTNYVHARRRPIELSARGIGDLVVNTSAVAPVGYVTILETTTDNTHITAVTSVLPRALVFDYYDVSGIKSLETVLNLSVGTDLLVNGTGQVNGVFNTGTYASIGASLTVFDTLGVGTAWSEDYRCLLASLPGGIATLRSSATGTTLAGKFDGRVRIEPTDAGAAGAPALYVQAFEEPSGRPAAEFWGANANSGAPYTVYIIADDGSPALLAEAIGDSAAVDALGGFEASAPAVKGTARHAQGFGGLFYSDTFATAAGAALSAIAYSSGYAGNFSAVSGAAVYMSTTTGPHLKFNAPASAPTNAVFEGEVFYQQTRGLGAAVPSDTSNPIYWVASQGGGVAGGGATHNTISTSTGTTWLTLHTETLSGVHAPKIANKILCMLGTWELGSTGAATTVEIRILDATSNAVIQSWTTNLNDTGTTWEKTETRIVRRTVPAIGDRSFSVQFRRGAAVNVQGQNGGLFFSPAMF